MTLNIKKYVKRHSTVKGADGIYVDGELNKISDSVSSIAEAFSDGLALSALEGIATARFLGNISGSTASPIALTGTEVTANLDLFDATHKGLTPAPTTSTGKLLKDDATWIAPDQIIATAGQLQFPGTQVPSSDVNCLDDYEEGSWTPGIAFGGGTTGLTYTSQSGSYVKIGKLVHIQGVIVVNNNGSSTGSATLTGLPFTAHTTLDCIISAYVDQSTSGSLYTFGNIVHNTTTVQLLLDFSGDSPWDDAGVLNGAVIRIGGTYIATA